MQRYRTRVVEVDAVRLTKSVLVADVKGKPGDWLVAGPSNQLAVMPDNLFCAQFELISGAPAEQVTPERRRRGGRRPGPKPGKKPKKVGGGGKPMPAAPTVQSRAGSSIRALPSEALREECRKLFEDDGLKLVAIAEQKGVKYSTLYNWKTNGGWEQ